MRLSADPDDPEEFSQQVKQVCQLYEDAPALYAQGVHLVSTDEMTGIQALERTHPSKPMRPGQVELVEFEYIRHGTQSLIANWEVALGRVGTRKATNARIAAAAAEIVEPLWQWVLLQSHVHVDESPWPVMGLKEWLWVVTGQKFCLFHAGDTRSRNELEVMLGNEFRLILSSDDFSVYNGYQVLGQQKCLAHLRRHFKKVIKLGHGNNPILGQAFLDLIDEAEAQHRRWRETQDGAAYREWAASFKLKVAQSLQQWLGQAGHAAGLLLRTAVGRYRSYCQIATGQSRAVVVLP